MLNGFHGCEVVINLNGMSMNRPFTEVNLSVPVASEYAVVSPAVSKVTQCVQNVIVKATYCIVMLDNLYIVARKMTMLEKTKTNKQTQQISAGRFSSSCNLSFISNTIAFLGHSFLVCSLRALYVTY